MRRLKNLKKKGGIVDKRGQWAHPGKVTTIPSNQITMNGVNYPVLGVSDSGHIQMMFPNQDYRFEGNSVTEYPILQTGGRTPIKGTKEQYQAYQDSLNLHNATLMQDKLMGKNYTSPIYPMTKNDWTLSAAKERRTKKPWFDSKGKPVLDASGKQHYIADDFQNEKEMFADGYDAWFTKEDKKLIDYYKSLKFSFPIDIEYHNSPDLVNDKIRPVRNYFDGRANSPYYTKPVQPIIYEPEERIILTDYNDPRKTDSRYKAIDDGVLQRIYDKPINNLQSSEPDLLQGNNQQLEFNSIPYKKGSYFTREPQSQELGKKEYYDKSGKLLGEFEFGGNIEIRNEWDIVDDWEIID